MKEWKEYKIGDVFAYLKSGKGIHANEISSKGEYPVFGGNGLRGYTTRNNFEGDCAIIGRQGAFCGNVRYFKGKAYMTEHAIIAVANENNSTRFLAYLLGIMNLGRFSGQSAQPGLSVTELAKQSITVPSLSVQKKIATILSSLDDKIELNRRINGNLEQQAQALFKAWFVDFEPFKSGKFVDSELGRIPEGWKVGRLDEIGEIVGGGTPSKSKAEYYCDKGIPWVTPKDLSITHAKFTSKGEVDISDLGYKNSSTQILPKGSVLFSSRAPIGYITIALNDICTNQGFKSVIPKIAGTAFIYCYLKNNIKNIESQATGSTFKEASGSLMKSLKVLRPDDISIYRRFEEVETSLFEKQAALEEENLRLSTLRDTLLPQLMSGELKINDLNR